MSSSRGVNTSTSSPPSRWCGLKSAKTKSLNEMNSSPPSRWCGLKSPMICLIAIMLCVTTFAVVWIEIFIPIGFALGFIVTTFAVVWIEIDISQYADEYIASPPSRWCGLKYIQDNKFPPKKLSPPSRWCGLKFSKNCVIDSYRIVTTFAVVWIEIQPAFAIQYSCVSHHLRGGVD